MIFLQTVPMRCFFCGSFLLFVFCVCLSCCLARFLQHCDHLLALFYEMLSCVFVTFSYCVLGQVWYMILSITDLCFFLTLVKKHSYFVILGILVFTLWKNLSLDIYKLYILVFFNKIPLMANGLYVVECRL